MWNVGSRHGATVNLGKNNKFFETNIKLDRSVYSYALGIFTKLGKVLTLFQQNLVERKDEKKLLEKVQEIAYKYDKSVKENTIDKIIGILLKIRENARNSKDWKTADSIREDLDKIGFEIQDTSKGTVWRKK